MEQGVSPFWDYIGMKELKAEDGYAELRLDITQDFLQKRGAVHGGVIATLIDGAIYSAVHSVMSEEEASVTVEMKINYLASAKGEYLIAKSKLFHYGRTLSVGQAEIFDSNDKLVAVGNATFLIFKNNKQ